VIAIFTSRSHCCDVEKATAHFLRNANAYWSFASGFNGGSIEAFSFVNPIIIDKDENILAGHGRIEAAKSLGLGWIPSVRFCASRLRSAFEAYCWLGQFLLNR